MDVSNSTGEGTGYRVVGSGGATPGTWKEKTRKKSVNINGTLYEVLREGTLKPNTYVTLRISGKPCLVQFFQKNKTTPICTCNVPEESNSKAVAVQSAEILIAVMQNGQGSPVTHVYRKA